MKKRFLVYVSAYAKVGQHIWVTTETEEEALDMAYDEAESGEWVFEDVNEWTGNVIQEENL